MMAEPIIRATKGLSAGQIARSPVRQIVRFLASDGAVAFMQEGRRAMKRDRWLLVEENGDLWLLKREGHELHGRIVSREGLRNEFPRLYAALVATNNKDTPRVVVER